MPLPQVIKDLILAALDDLPRPKDLAGKVTVAFQLNYNPSGLIGSVKQIHTVEQELR